MAKLEQLLENEEFVAKLDKCETESEMEALRNEYADSVEVDAELDEDALQSFKQDKKILILGIKYMCLLTWMSIIYVTFTANSCIHKKEEN